MAKKKTESPARPGSASGLQPGGTIPGGGPTKSAGSLGTGGGSTAGEPTGSKAQKR